MKVLIIGALGFLGKELAKDFSRDNEVACADKQEGARGLYYLDLPERGLVKEVFAQTRPEMVLLPAAISGVDWCEGNQEMVWSVNVEGPKEVAVAAKRAGAFLVFYSTDYLFDGKNGPYDEEASAGPINFYGKTKLEAERIIKKELKRFLILRTCSIYGYQKDGKNYAMQVLERLTSKNAVTAPRDQFGTPTYVEDLSAVTLQLVNKRKEGIYNAVGPDYVNRVQFAEGVADIFGLEKALIKGVSSEKLKQAAERPKKGGLKIEKLKLEAGIQTMGLREGLLAMKKRLGL